MVVSRLAEVQFVDPNTDINMATLTVPYGSSLFFKDGDVVKKGDVVCKWDPFNAVIVSEYAGKLQFDNVIEGATFKTETDETSGMTERIITESKDHNVIPTVHVVDENGQVLGTYNFPVGGHIANIEDGQVIETGTTLVTRQTPLWSQRSTVR